MSEHLGSTQQADAPDDSASVESSVIRPPGELMYRTATQLGVSFPKRMIELVAMPYETETLVEHKGRMVRETITRGAFDGIERRANRVRVNRDHIRERTVGRAVAFHPSREEGLVAEIRIAQTELGDETLTLADEECLDASSGFLPMPGGERWLTRSSVRYSRCWLGHIALTPDPAYETARVLSVRQATNESVTGVSEGQVSTPNLDTVRGWLLADQWERINPS